MTRRSVTDRGLLVVVGVTCLTAAVAWLTVPVAAQDPNLERCESVGKMLHRFVDRMVGPTRVKGELTIVRETKAASQLEIELLTAAIARMQSATMSAAELTRNLNDEARRGNKVLPKETTDWLATLDSSRPAVPVQAAQQRQAAVRATLAAASERENEVARLVNLLQDQLSELNCPGAARRVGDLPANQRPADSTAGGAAVSTTSAGATTTTTTTTTPGEPVAATPDDWKDTWTHEFGTITLQRRALDQTSFIAGERLRPDNVYGAKVECDERAVYTGEVSWERAGGSYDRPWNGRVFACTNGNFLEGKFSNFGMHSAGEQTRSGSFKIAIVKDDKKEFAGKYRPYDVTARRAAAETPWTGKK